MNGGARETVISDLELDGRHVISGMGDGGRCFIKCSSQEMGNGDK